MMRDATLTVHLEIRVGPLVVWLMTVALLLATLVSAVSPVSSPSTDELWSSGDDEGVLPQTW